MSAFQALGAKSGPCSPFGESAVPVPVLTSGSQQSLLFSGSRQSLSLSCPRGVGGPRPCPRGVSSPCPDLGESAVPVLSSGSRRAPSLCPVRFSCAAAWEGRQPQKVSPAVIICVKQPHSNDHIAFGKINRLKRTSGEATNGPSGPDDTMEQTTWGGALHQEDGQVSLGAVRCGEGGEGSLVCM